MKDCDSQPTAFCRRVERFGRLGALGSSLVLVACCGTRPVEGDVPDGISADVPPACASGFSDCDGDPTNGCEADLQHSEANCGGCGSSCMPSQACVLGQCQADGVVQVAVGSFHSCARLASGAVYCWGRNHLGQLGDGTLADRSIPSPVLGIDDAREISSGASHSCAIIGAGSLVCWGFNQFGGLGDGTTIERTMPVRVGMTDVLHVSAGQHYTCAIRGSGELSCWGSNSTGQLGDGTTVDRSTPGPVPALRAVRAVATGIQHTCAALATTGEVRCWGENYHGELGNGTTVNAFTPVAVVGLRGAVGVAASYFSCAALASGSVSCWGDNFAGKLGDGSLSDSSVPVSVVGISDGLQVTCGGYHTCAVRASGAADCWGGNDYGQLGDGSGAMSVVPVAVLGVGDAVQISAARAAGRIGYRHTCAARRSGAVACWGLNTWGQLGDGTTTDRPTPVTVVGLP